LNGKRPKNLVFILCLTVSTSLTYGGETTYTILLTPDNIDKQPPCSSTPPFSYTYPPLATYGEQLYPGCIFQLPSGSTSEVRSLRNLFVGFIDPTPHGALVKEITIEAALTKFCTITAEPVTRYFFGRPMETQAMGPDQYIADCLVWPCQSPAITVDTVFALRTADPADLGYTYRWIGGSSPPNCFLANWDGDQPHWAYQRIVISYIPPPKVVFEITASTPEADRRVLVNKYRATDSYTSRYQLHDGEMTIRGTVVDDNGQPIPSKRFCLRVSDPKDPSPYIATYPPPTADDNYGGLATLVGQDSYGVLCTQTDTLGTFETQLLTTRRYAGDNYQIDGSIDETMIRDRQRACTFAENCTSSGVITTWKRVYVESDEMVGSGAFLSETTSPSSRRLKYYSQHGVRFSVGDEVVLLHSPANGGGSALGFYSEGPYSITATGNRWIEINTGNPTNPGPVNTFYGNSTTPARSDAIALTWAISTGFTPRYTANDSLVATLWGEAFVEYRRVPSSDNTLTIFPYVYQPTTATLMELAGIWSEQFTQANTFYLFGAETEGSSSADLGYTVASNNFSVVFVKQVTIGSSAPEFNEEVTVHELTHEWAVNLDKSTADHCDRDTWEPNDGPAECIMTTNLTNGTAAKPQMTDGVVDFHNTLFDCCDSEHVRIRQKTEPVP
jgi:hypothetical protein